MTGRDTPVSPEITRIYHIHVGPATFVVAYGDV